MATRSGYELGRTVEEVAQEQAERLLAQLKEGKVSEDTPHSVRTLHQREYTLAVGGPALDVTFLVDPREDEVLGGWVTYYEVTQARIDLSLTDAMNLYEALNNPADNDAIARLPEAIARNEVHVAVGKAGKVPAVRIWLHRAEGRREECTEHTFEGPDVWGQARGQLFTWSYTAPNDGSVDKTDFKVTYQDGQEYSGTFGLTRTDVNLPRHMRRHLEHLLAHPKTYARYVEDARKFLETCEIGRPEGEERA